MYILETPRLYLRELRPDDQAELSKVLSDPVSMQYYPHPFSAEEVRCWILKNIDRYHSPGFGLWAVILKDSDTFVGDCGITLQNIDGELLPEIGYHILPEYQRHGFAAEAALACKEYACSVLGFERVYAYFASGNIPSQRVAAKIGLGFWKKYVDSDGIERAAYM